MTIADTTWQKPHGPILSVEDAATTITRRFPRGELVLAQSTTLHATQLQRWIIASVSREMRWIELWTTSTLRGSSLLWQLLRAENYDPIWAEGLIGGVPAAVHSWSYLWTVGPRPLRMWKRRRDRSIEMIDLSGPMARGLVFATRSLRVEDLGRARVKRTALREICAISTPIGDVAVVSRLRFGSGFFAFLSGIAGPLDSFEEIGPSIELFVHRLNAALRAGV